MKVLGPTRLVRLNEACGVVFLFAALFLSLSLISYSPLDPSWNTAAGAPAVHNLTGRVGAHIADFCLQVVGLAAFALPVFLLFLAWKWLRSAEIDGPLAKLCGSMLVVSSVCTLLALAGDWRPIGKVVPASGLAGIVFAEFLTERFNRLGAALLTGTCLILSLYLASTFSMAKLAVWFARPLAFAAQQRKRFMAWRADRIARARETARLRAEMRARARQEKALDSARPRRRSAAAAQAPPVVEDPVAHAVMDETPPWEEIEDIPIRTLEPEPPASEVQSAATPALETSTPAARRHSAPTGENTPRRHTAYETPATSLLQEPQARSPYDSQELKEIAASIKSKFEEFSVHGSVTQINPGPVVTTFEFKPEAGVKYSRITTLSEDLCLGLQAESILIERIPGKPTVGIEVPNTKREVIGLRQILESEEFRSSASPLTISLGKDINGRIKVAAIDTMPHLLIAGSTGSGKSVMLNSLIMSILYKATPEQVRMILVDPKRLEMGLYEGIPHLLTPVITDAKKATNALRNAVLEMERRLKLLASQGVRNIEQYNRKVRQMMNEPRSLFEDEDKPDEEALEPLPYILVLIDELADLMMVERANVEEAVTRLAQMARAIGMHLVLATQRPSVDVITGLIKANFPARISFRVATRVDSRTVLDVMGAEHLLGKGDMLYLPPGSSRLTRVHGAYVTEAEINRVVEFWKRQAEPEYDKSFLMAPPAEPDGGAEDEDFDAAEDPLYQDAVRVVLEVGKASTSTLQRRLSLGYGRAARILDMMQHEGIIGPPNGSKPREVLKRPDWLEEIENQMR